MPSVPSHVPWGFVALHSSAKWPKSRILAPWRRYCRDHCPKFSLLLDGTLLGFSRSGTEVTTRRREEPHVLRRLPDCPLAEADVLEDLLGSPVLFAPGVDKAPLQDFGHLRRTVALDRLVTHLDDQLSTLETGQARDLRFLIAFHGAASYALKYGLLLAVPWPAGRTKDGTRLAGARPRRR